MAKKADETGGLPAGAETVAASPATDTTPAGATVEATIEEHAEALKVPAWQLAGLKRLRRWGIGKRVARAEFERELNAWLNGPMDQRRARA